MLLAFLKIAMIQKCYLKVQIVKYIKIMIEILYLMK